MPRASAYGGQATAVGTVKTGQPLAVDLTGRAANVDLRNLPPVLNAPGVPSRLQFAYTLTGRGSVFSGDVTFRESTLAGAQIAPGTIASFSVGDGAPRYAGKGEVSNLDVQQIGRGFNITALAADRYQSRVNATFDVQGSGGGARYPLALDATGTVVDSEMFGASFPRLDFTTSIANLSGGDGSLRYAGKGEVSNLDVQKIGRDFDITALAADRYQSRVNATFDVKGSGGGARDPLALDATGTVVDSEMFGASFPRLDFTTNLAGGDMKVSAIGQFAHLDPAVITGNDKVKGSLSGAVDVKTTIRNYAGGVTVDSIDVSGRVNLGTSELGGLAINTAAIDGTYANRTGELTQVSIVGPDLNVTGQGMLALNDTGSSNLTLHAETPSLDHIGAIIGQPLKGGAIVDATVTGNARELQAQGTLKGSNIGHGENEALSLATDFTVKIPAADAGRCGHSGQEHRDVPRDRRTEDHGAGGRHDLFAVDARIQRDGAGGDAPADGRRFRRLPPGPPGSAPAGSRAEG